MSKRSHIISLFIWGGFGALWGTDALITTHPIWRIIYIVGIIMAIMFFAANLILLLRKDDPDTRERPPAALDPFKAGWRANLACLAWIIFAALIASWIARKLNLHGELDELLFMLIVTTVAILPVFYLTMKLHKDK